jgi:hypothetical protein
MLDLAMRVSVVLSGKQYLNDVLAGIVVATLAQFYAVDG